MKRRFLPFSLLLVIMVLGQSVMANQMGHYVPRSKETSNPEAYMSSLRVNQHTGLIDPALMIEASKQARVNTRESNDYDLVYWHSMGPINMGGRTTSIVYNKTNPHEVYIGSMGSGVYYTWNFGISWHQVGDELMVSCLAQTEDGTIYVGTGDGGAAATYNGLSDVAYANSFVGSGLYKINNNVMTRVESTIPSTQNDAVEWSFINDIAVIGNTVIVATNDGLRYSNDGGATWTYAKSENADVTGIAAEVKIASDNTVLASVDGKFYIGSLTDLVCHSAEEAEMDTTGAIVKLPISLGMLDIAVAPSDDNVIYVADIDENGNHVNIYCSEDKGQTWRVILPAVDSTFGHQVYGGKGLFNNGITVDPENPDRLYITGYDLWRLERPVAYPDGYYITVKLSDGNNTQLYDVDQRYLHSGVNAMVFEPNSNQKAYIATDGGIFKGTVAGGGYFTYENCNRGYVSTRCFAVAPSGKTTRVVAGLLDHGPILIEGDENTNLMGTAVPLYPYNSVSYYGIYDETYHGGPCVVSLINPDVFVLTTVDGGIKRTETAGADYDVDNFSTFTYTGYRMPVALWESFDDQNSVDSVWFKNTTNANIPAGSTIQCFSNNGNYPFDYVVDHTLHANLEDNEHGDSIQVVDPVMSKFYVAVDLGIYMTMDVLKFDAEATFYKLGTPSGTPMCLTVSPDGDVLFVGTREGSLIRISNLRAAVDDSTALTSSSQFAPVVTAINLPVSDQCVTSVAISNDNEKIVVTLGNYGNDQYVLYSANALADEPTFTVKDGNLPKAPVYSSIIDMTTGDVLVGTEHGIYRNKNIAGSAVWEKADDQGRIGDVPVMDLKQQTVYHPTQYVPGFIDDTPVMFPRQGAENQGVIYAATYGHGLFYCETYKQHVGASVPETVTAASKVSMFPNPVHTQANLSFEVNDNAKVSYQVFDMSGRMVMNQTLGNYTEGHHEISVNMESLASGSYVLRLNAGSKVSSVKFLVY